MSAACRLHDQVNRAAVGIGTFDGQGNPFAMLVKTHDDGLSRLVLAGDAWSVDEEAFDSWCDKFRVNDFEHSEPRGCSL